MPFFSAPPTGLVRLLFAAPLWLYRMRLGWLLGQRFARLTHRGRRTGRVRQNVIEVVRFDPRTREIVAAAGWGGRTDWYRNIQAAAALEIRTGRLAYRPTVRFLTDDEVVEEFRGYMKRHRWLARYILPRIFDLPVNTPDSDLLARVETTLKGVSFRPQPSADWQDAYSGSSSASRPSGV